MTELRPYQTRAIDALRASYARGHQRVVLVLPTGAGKTAVATAIIRAAAARGRRALFLAHRQELVGQAERRLRAEGLTSLRTIRAAQTLGPHDAQVTVASIPTLARRMDRLPEAELVIFDEAHHVAAKTWAELASHYQGAHILGLTATPERQDGRPMGDIFQDLVVGATVAELTDAGYLVPCRVLAPPTTSSKLADNPAEWYAQHGAGRRAAIFCANRKFAKEVAAAIPGAGYIDGETQLRARAETLAGFQSGAMRVLVNVGVLTEGWDDPGVELCILARKPAHASLYLQIAGRVLRPAPGKVEATLVDLCGVVHQHGTPEEPRLYSLKGKAITRVSEIDGIRLTQCPACGSTLKPQATCPECGFVFQGREVEIAKRRLEQIEAFRKHTQERRDAYRANLAITAREKGYRVGWVYHQMRARYGHG